MIRGTLFTGVAAGLLAACSAGAQPANETDPVGREAGVLTIEPRALALRLDAGEAIQLIDVRTPEEYAEGHLAGAINIPLDEFEPQALPDTNGAQRILYCRSGRRSGIAAERLAASGTEAIHLEGGILAWESGGLPVVRD